MYFQYFSVSIRQHLLATSSVIQRSAFLCFSLFLLSVILWSDLIHTHDFSDCLCFNTSQFILPVQFLIISRASCLLDILSWMPRAYLKHIPKYTYLFSLCAPDLSKQYHYPHILSHMKPHHYPDSSLFPTSNGPPRPVNSMTCV